jgi:hypothetical protein
MMLQLSQIDIPDDVKTARKAWNGNTGPAQTDRRRLQNEYLKGQ